LCRKNIIYYIKKRISLLAARLSRSPKVRLEVGKRLFPGAFSKTILNDGSKNYETKMAVGVVGAPSSGIELVLKQISLPLAQIRVICKNGPQVSIDDIKCSTLV
jgi:hypothetical protein